MPAVDSCVEFHIHIIGEVNGNDQANIRLIMSSAYNPVHFGVEVSTRVHICCKPFIQIPWDESNMESANGDLDCITIMTIPCVAKKNCRLPIVAIIYVSLCVTGSRQVDLNKVPTIVEALVNVRKI